MCVKWYKSLSRVKSTKYVGRIKFTPNSSSLGVRSVDCLVPALVGAESDIVHKEAVKQNVTRLCKEPIIKQSAIHPVPIVL